MKKKQILHINGYTIWQNKDGLYGITKDCQYKGLREDVKPPHCAYRYMWAMLKLKNI